METQNRFAGKLSEDYELVRAMIPHYDEHEDTVRQAIAAYARTNKRPHLGAVDVGCGTGYTSMRILDADPRITVLAIDNEPAMVRQARERLGARAHVEEKDALAALSTLPAGSIDIVASGCVLHNLPPLYRREVVQEVARVLTQGGLYVNADKLGLDDGEEHRKALAAQLENLSVLTEMGRPDLEEAWHAHYLEDEEINFTEGEQKSLLTEFGFEDIQTIYRKRLEATVTAVKR